MLIGFVSTWKKMSRNKIKKTKRLHQLYQDWLKILEMDDKIKAAKRDEFSIFKQPLAGKWYYEYRNDKGAYVGLAKLQHMALPFSKRKWMWETCTTNEVLKLCRFPTQKQAEIAIYKFLSH